MGMPILLCGLSGWVVFMLFIQLHLWNYPVSITHPFHRLLWCPIFGQVFPSLFIGFGDSERRYIKAILFTEPFSKRNILVRNKENISFLHWQGSRNCGSHSREEKVRKGFFLPFQRSQTSAQNYLKGLVGKYRQSSFDLYCAPRCLQQLERTP